MSERPSAAKQYQQIIEMLGVINERLAKIETKIEYQPKLDEQRFATLEKSEASCRTNIEKKFDDHEERLTVVESKPGKRWDLIVTGIISAGVMAFVDKILKW